MIEVRPFGGDPAELAALVNASWQGRYLARDLIPVYDAAGLQYQVLGDPDSSLQLAAYDGRRLVGCFLADHLTLRVAGERWRGSQGSYFSVHPDYASRGVGLRLINRLERAHREQALAFMLGYVNSSKTAPAYQFWTRFRRSFPKRYRALRDVQFWMRFVKPQALSGVMDNAAEALGLRALLLLQGVPRSQPNPHLRPFTPADQAACHLLLDRAAARSPLAQVWDSGALRRELSDDQAATLVYTSAGSAAGFSTSFRWPLLSKGSIPAEVVDLLLMDDLNAGERRALLNATVRASAERGAWISIVPRTDGRYADTLLSCGFVPVPKVCTLIMLFPDPQLDLGAVRAANSAGPIRFR